MHVLVFNAGSSNLKFGLFDSRNERKLAGDTRPNDAAAVEAIARALPNVPVDAIGHRVVHGGSAFRASVPIDAHVKTEINHLSVLSPLHNPPALAVIKAAETTFPDVPQIAVFDTSFFADLPLPQSIYPVPYAWHNEWGLRRFGFHGISHQYCMERAAEMLKRPLNNLRLIVCHLGNGCSATAIRDGRPVATTMGFTPLEGLMMGSRSGSIDPGLLLYLEREKHLSAAELEHILNEKSGLLGVSGVSADFRDVEEAAKKRDPRAQLALDIYVDRIRSAVGALATSLERIDAVAFTGGVGENSALLRERVCQPLALLGISIDKRKNNNRKPDAFLHPPQARVAVLAIHTEEERMIAKETVRLLPALQRLLL